MLDKMVEQTKKKEEVQVKTVKDIKEVCTILGLITLVTRPPTNSLCIIHIIAYRREPSTSDLFCP